MVVHAQNDLRRPIEATLDVGVDLFVFEATAAKVDDFHSAFGRVLEEDILGLEVTVNNAMMAEQ